MFGFWGKETFDKNKFKAGLKMAVTRMKMQQNKRQNGIKMQRAEVAMLMRDEKNESARIKVEQVMRDEYYIEALDLLMLFCELLSSRLLLFQESKTCPPDLKEALSTVVWACPRTDGIAELIAIRKQIALKLGKEWIDTAMQNSERAVNQRVADKLSVLVPDPAVCMQYLEGICNEYDLDWSTIQSSLSTTDLVPESAGVWNNGKADPAHPPPSTIDFPAGLPPAPACGNCNHPSNIAPPPFATSNASTVAPPNPYGAAPTAPQPNDFSDLEARFEAIKRQ